MAEPIKYKLKTDPMGMVGRECPRDRTYFKVPVNELECEEMTCPVCGVKLQCIKFTTIPQVDYINSLIFHKDGCPIHHDGHSKMPPCHDYVEMPAENLYSCDVCGKCFGLDNKKPDRCPFCVATREHLHQDIKCNYLPPAEK